MSNLVVSREELEVVSKERVEIEIFTKGMYAKTAMGDVVIEAYLSTLNSPHTAKAYRRSIYEFFKALYPCQTLTARMFIIDPIHAVAYVDMLKSQLESGDIKKSSTFNSKIKGVRQFYDWLIKQTTSNTKDVKLFNINPFDAVKMISENDTEGSEPLTPEEVVDMLYNPIGESEHLKTRNRLLLELAISTGIRNDALLNIRLEDIVYMNNEWVIDTIDKNSKKSIKPINNYYKQLVEWYESDMKIRSRDNGTIFNLHPHSANRLVKEWAESRKIDKKITFHSFRTTTAVQVYHTNGDNLGVAQIILDHAHAETTINYLGKEKKINHSAENIVEIMKGAVNEFENLVSGMTREELVEMVLSLDMNTKMKIIRDRM